MLDVSLAPSRPLVLPLSLSVCLGGRVQGDADAAQIYKIRLYLSHTHHDPASYKYEADIPEGGGRVATDTDAAQLFRVLDTRLLHLRVELVYLPLHV